METCIEYRTILENCTMNDILVNCTSNCTDLESVQYDNAEILTSKKLSRIVNSDFNGTNSLKFFTGNAPKNLV